MGEREVGIKIVVDDREATAKLQATDRAVDKIAATATSTGTALSAYDQLVQQVVKSKQALATATDTVRESLTATREAVQLNTVAVQDLFTWVDQGSKGWRDYADMARGAWAAIREAGGVTGIMERLGTVTGINVANLGFLGSAGLVLGTGYAAWGVGRMVADFFDLDKKIGNATASLLGWGSAAKEVAGAQQDSINLAIARGATYLQGITDKTTAYTLALQFNEKWVRNQIAGAKEMNDILARQNAPAEFTHQMVLWQEEIQKIQGAGGLPALKDALESHLFGVKELADSYRVSVGAISLYKRQLEDEAADHKRAAEEAKKHAAEAKRAAEEARKAAEQRLRAHEQLIDASESEGAAAVKAINASFGHQHVLMDLSVAMGDVILHSRPLNQEIGLIADRSERAAAKMAAARETTSNWEKNIESLGKAFSHLAQVSHGTFGAIATDVAQGVASFELIKKSSDTFKEGLADYKNGDKAEGFAQISAAIGGMVAAMDQATSHGSKLANTLHGALTGAEIGGQIGGPLGAAVGAGIGGLIGFFRDPEKQVNPIREAFVQLNGGLAALNARAHAAGMTLDHLLNAKNPEQYKKAIDELNAAFQFQDQAMHTLDDTVQKYGFTIDQLGPRFRQQKLDEQAGALVQDYRVLIASGIENVTVLEKMAPAMNDYLHTIMTAGGTIPTQLQGPLQKLVDMGLLTDLAGEKMTDLGQLTFAETLDQKFTTLIDTINKLANAISASLGTAIANIPDRTIHIGFDVDQVPDFRGERMHSGGVVLPFVARAHRGLAVDEVPIIAQRGEGILNRHAMRRIGGANGLNALNAGAGGVSVAISGLTVQQGMNERDAEELIGKTVVQAIRRRGIRVG